MGSVQQSWTSPDAIVFRARASFPGAPPRIAA
jgi:hypothetical protein